VIVYHEMNQSLTTNGKHITSGLYSSFSFSFSFSRSIFLYFFLSLSLSICFSLSRPRFIEVYFLYHCSVCYTLAIKAFYCQWAENGGKYIYINIFTFIH